MASIKLEMALADLTKQFGEQKILSLKELGPLLGKSEGALVALGVYPDVSLSLARERREEARKLLANGSDPGAVKQSQKRQAKVSAANSFEAIARELHAMKSPIWTPHHATDWINTLEREVFPKFGQRPIIEIEAPDVLDILRSIEARGFFEVSLLRDCSLYSDWHGSPGWK